MNLGALNRRSSFCIEADNTALGGVQKVSQMALEGTRRKHWYEEVDPCTMRCLNSF